MTLRPWIQVRGVGPTCTGRDAQKLPPDVVVMTPSPSPRPIEPGDRRSSTQHDQRRPWRDDREQRAEDNMRGLGGIVVVLVAAGRASAQSGDSGAIAEQLFNQARDLAKANRWV